MNKTINIIQHTARAATVLLLAQPITPNGYALWTANNEYGSIIEAATNATEDALLPTTDLTD